MAWWKRTAKPLEGKPQEAAKPAETSEKKSVPKGIWTRCDVCQEVLFGPDLEANLRVCPKCQHHFAVPTVERIAMIVDAGSFHEEDELLDATDPLEFKDSKKYRDRIRSAKKSSGAHEAYRAGAALLDGQPVEVGFFVFEYMGGSMGSVVGEKIARQFERACERRTPAIIFSASGGARMQEGCLSLMQMAKTSAALARLRHANLPYISVLLNPTTGGVAASFAMLGDLIVAEPKALIGFAGPRVIEQTIRQKLPEGFQRSEFLLERGMLDLIIPRSELKDRLAGLIALLMADPRKVEVVEKTPAVTLAEVPAVVAAPVSAVEVAAAPKLEAAPAPKLEAAPAPKLEAAPAPKLEAAPRNGNGAKLEERPVADAPLPVLPLPTPIV